MSFTGEFFAKLNSKNQVTLPSALREVFFSLGEGGAFVLYGRDGEDFIEIFPSSEWELIQKKTENIARQKKLPQLNRLLNRCAYPMKLEESGNGRIVIPSLFMKKLGGDPEVIFVGNTKKIELWNRQVYLSKYGEGADVEDGCAEELDEILGY